MLQSPRFEVLGISRRDFALVFTLLFNALTWSYMINTVIKNIPTIPIVRSSFSTVFYIAAAGASLAGAVLPENIRRPRFLNFWMLLGVISSFLLVFTNYSTIAQVSAIFIVLGISFGLGMPAALAHFGDRSTVENRARISSLILLPTNLIILPLAVLFMTSDPVMNAIILTGWRGLGLAFFLLLKPKQEAYPEKKKHVSFASVLQDRSFSLYLLPWVMFCLVDVLEKSLLYNIFSPELQETMLTVEPLVAMLFIVITGLLADRIGRKRVVIYGFVSLGVGYAIIGFLAPMAIEAWYFYFVVDAIAWSIFYTIFVLTLAGDLSQAHTREKYYAVASFPYVITSVIPTLLGGVLASVSPNTAFSLASFFLFVSVLPLMYAPETLPQKKIELQRLRGYLEQAKKMKDKNTGKSLPKKD